MRTRRAFINWSIRAIALCATASVSRAGGAREKLRLAIVVAQNSPITNISFYDLKRAYKGEVVNVAGQRLTPFNLPVSSEPRVGFDQVVLRMSREDANRYWIDRKIRGQSGPPRAIESADLLQRVVARSESAIGYVRVDELRPDVKVVLVNGKKPSDPGYPIEY
jgi:hypothetical protein